MRKFILPTILTLIAFSIGFAAKIETSQAAPNSKGLGVPDNNAFYGTKVGPLVAPTLPVNKETPVTTPSQEPVKVPVTDDSSPAVQDTTPAPEAPQPAVEQPETPGPVTTIKDRYGNPIGTSQVF